MGLYDPGGCDGAGQGGFGRRGQVLDCVTTLLEHDLLKSYVKRGPTGVVLDDAEPGELDFHCFYPSNPRLTERMLCRYVTASQEQFKDRAASGFSGLRAERRAAGAARAVTGSPRSPPYRPALWRVALSLASRSVGGLVMGELTARAETHRLSLALPFVPLEPSPPDMLRSCTTRQVGVVRFTGRASRHAHPAYRGRQILRSTEIPPSLAPPPALGEHNRTEDRRHRDRT